MTESLSITLTAIRERVVELHRHFVSCPSAYLNECDLQSELFALLLADFSESKPVENVFVWGTDRQPPTLPFPTRRLHSELLLPAGRVDIAVLDLAHLRVAVNPKGRFGHLQLGNDEKGEHVFIEIKASRTNRSELNRAKWTRVIKKDIGKSNRIKYHSLVLCFHFGGVLDEAEISALRSLTNANVELLYFQNPGRDRYLAR